MVARNYNRAFYVVEFHQNVFHNLEKKSNSDAINKHRFCEINE